MTELDPATEAGLTDLYRDIGAYDLQPLWTQAKDLMSAAPRPATLAHRWRWRELRALAERSGELITIDRGGDRRVLALANPGLGGAPFAAATLWAAIQYLRPGERAPAHRHSQSALRFVLEGEGAWTTVDGDAVDMRPGDVVLTPAGRWHDHCNGGDEPMVWFDGLDIPLVRALDAGFFEAHPSDDPQPVPAPHNRTERRHGRAGVRPGGSDLGDGLLVYRWSDIDATLTTLLDEGSTDASVDLVDVATGGPVLPTLAVSLQRIDSGGATTPQRQVGHRVVVVFRGRGTSRVGEVTLDWDAGDVLVVPSWATVTHEAEVRADLFTLSDEPTMRALGLFRSELLT